MWTTKGGSCVSSRWIRGRPAVAAGSRYARQLESRGAWKKLVSHGPQPDIRRHVSSQARAQKLRHSSQPSEHRARLLLRVTYLTQYRRRFGLTIADAH